MNKLFLLVCAVPLLLWSFEALAGDCCEPSNSPGCDSWAIESCVCDQDPYCCNTAWDGMCVDEVEQFGCGDCSSGPPPGQGDCCEEQNGPGCGNSGIQNCVCAQDSYCCETKWDNICADEVEEFGCGDCGGGGGQTCPGYTGNSACCMVDDPCGWENDNICDCDGTCAWNAADCGAGGCGDGNCEGDENCNSCPQDCGQCGGGDCCEPQNSPGCGDASIQNCVCTQDDFCCNNTWDEICVNEIEEFGCGNCNGGGGCGNGSCEDGEDCGSCPQDCGQCGSGDCCQPQDGPGCGDAWVQDCVCADDAYCCNNQWDQMCVDEVESFGCGQCDGGSEKCPGYNGSSVCCMVDDPCDWEDDGICDCDGTCSWNEADCGGGGGCGDGNCGDGEHCGNCPEDCGQCGGGDCCEPQDGPGCGDAAVQDCVCAEDAYCCNTAWDNICVNEVAEFGCGQCDGGGAVCPGYGGWSECCETDDPCGWAADGICDCEGTCAWDGPDCGGEGGCGDGGCADGEDCESCPEDCGFCPGGGDCCEANGTPGCDNAGIQDCVCLEDAYCCNTAWDSICAGEVESLGCGSCEGGPECGNGQCQAGESCESCPEDCGACPGQGDCCEVQDGPGCDDPTIQACVCAEDSFCCEFTWDSICVEEVEEFGCGDCGGGGGGCGDGACGADEDCLICPEDCGQCGGTSCCEPHDSPGCEDAAVQQCVCAEDVYCCDVEWDGICVNEVNSLGCGDCEGGPTCGDGDCVGGETCSNCPEDCGQCPELESCCEPHDSPGCDDPNVQACVCELDAYCCETAWDEICVDEVGGEGCGSCEGCIPDCTGKECGGDGCTGTCGECGPQESCQNGKCIGGCAPQCAGKECGNDGCGGSCGDCAPGKDCQGGKCIGCQPQCAGKQCGADGCGGSCGECAPGSFCANGHCSKECKPDCAGKQCGNDGCGGSCGNCPPNFFCTPDGHCDEKCIPSCAGKQCGSDGCGGSCGSCPFGYECNGQGHCAADCQPQCSGKQCGDDGCNGSCGQCGPQENCNLQGHCVANCTPQCVNKECGTDGCGGACGQCGFGQVCNGENKCVDQDPGCQPNCLNKECGADGCGGTCGACGGDDGCNALGQCVSCTPACVGKQCGDDGCGGECGQCPVGLKCYDDTGECLAPDEVPDPVQDTDVTTGGDGSGSAGDCADGMRMVYGKCVPVEVDETGGDADSGCTMSGGSEGTTPAVLLLVLLCLALAVLRSRPRQSPQCPTVP